MQLVLKFDVVGTWGYIKYNYASAVFFTPNDLGLFLCAYAILALFSDKPTAVRVAIFAIVLAINCLNSSRIAVAASLMIGFAAFAIPALGQRMRFASTFVLLTMVAVGGLFLSAAAALQIDDASLLWSAIQRISTLDPFHLKGSIFDRTDAFIYSFQAYQKSFGFGTGPGGSNYIFSLPYYSGMTAQSIHNAIAELAFDLGPAFSVPFLSLVLWRIFDLMRRPFITMSDASRLTLLVTLPLLAAVQSAGYISNYAFWICAALIWLRTENDLSFNKGNIRLRQ